MKKIILLIFLLSSASTVLAQSGNRLHLYAAGGLALPVSSDFFDNFRDNRTPGLSLEMGAGYNLTHRSAFMIRYEYNRFSFEENSFTSLDESDGLQVFSNSNLSHSSAIKGYYRFTPFPHRRPVAPFLIAGAGAVHITDRIGQLAVSGNESTAADASYQYWEAIFAFGAGFRYELPANWALIFEARFDVVADDYDPVQVTPIKIGLEF